MPIGRAVALAVTVAGLATACQTIKTVHDADPNADFTRYRSWAWITDEKLFPLAADQADPSYVSPGDEKRIRGAVESELTRKGYGKASADSAETSWRCTQPIANSSLASIP